MPAHRPEDALARVVLDRCLGIRPGESVTIESWSHALPWARALVLECRRRDAEPTLVVEDEEAFFRTLLLPDVRAVPRAPATLAMNSDAYVYLGGPEHFPRLLGLAPADLETVLGRHDPGWWRAARRVGLRAARLAIADVTDVAAARFGVDAVTWRREVLRASLVDPERLARAAHRLTRRLARARRLRVTHPNGTDLTVELERGRGRVEDGRVDRADRRTGRIWTDVPTGLVAVPLDESGTEGSWEANRPVYDRFADPSVALGAQFSFRGGRVSEWSFDRGGEPFAAAYARAGRGREVPGALTFGVNPALSKAPELGEIAAGSVGLLLGDNRAAGGHRRARFAYLTTLTEATVEIDGRPWLSDGRVSP
jgi:leucyl aminopeptidase (aminopeptidase T)